MIEAIKLHELGSPATLPRKLDDLRLASTIQTDFLSNNFRAKYLILTQITNTHFVH